MDAVRELVPPGSGSGSGVVAWVAGAAVMTAAANLEQAVTSRPDSRLPRRPAERLLGLEPAA